MDRVVTTTINGMERTLNYSIEIMFEVTEKYGAIHKALELLSKDGKEAFEVLRWFAGKMANDGELCRRAEGMDPLPMLKEAEIGLRMHPLEYRQLKEAVIKAVILGYQVETDNGEEPDLDLAEVEAKKQKAGA